MASITLRNIDDSFKERLRVKAAKNGHSMAEEAHIILRRAVSGMTGPALLSMSEKIFAADHGSDLELPSRDDERKTPRFN